MTNQPRFITRLAAGAGMAALLLAGCTAGDWRESSPPAAGVHIDAKDVKLRSLVLVTNDTGDAVLLGAGVSPKADVLTGVAVSPVAADGSLGQASVALTNISFTADALTQTNIRVTDRALRAGQTASLTLRFERSGEATVIVPIVASTHPDFKDAYAKVAR